MLEKAPSEEYLEYCRCFYDPAARQRYHERQRVARKERLQEKRFYYKWINFWNWLGSLQSTV